MNKGMIGGLLWIFKYNWGVNIDSSEVDSTLSYSENFYHLYYKYVKLRPEYY